MTDINEIVNNNKKLKQKIAEQEVLIVEMQKTLKKLANLDTLGILTNTYSVMALCEVIKNIAQEALQCKESKHGQ